MGAAESRDQFVAVWSRLARRRGRAAGDLWAASPFALFNALTLTGRDVTAEDLAEQLVRAAENLRYQDQGGYLWVFEELLSPDTRAELDDRASAAGLEVAFTGHSMDGDLTLDEPQHPDLIFRRAETEDDLQTFGEINALAYDLQPAVGQFAFADAKLLLDEAYAYIGYRDGRAVTCAAAIPSEDAAVVAFVATLPEDSRRGYGEAVTRQAISAAGHHHVVLHATAVGRPVFERVGLRATGVIHFLQPTGAVDDLGD